MSCTTNGACCALSWQLIRSFAAKKEAEVEVASRVNEAREKAEFRIAHGITKEEYESIIAEAFRCVAASLLFSGMRSAWSAHPCDSARDCGEHRPRRSDAPATLHPCHVPCHAMRMRWAALLREQQYTLPYLPTYLPCREADVDGSGYLSRNELRTFANGRAAGHDTHTHTI